MLDQQTQEDVALPRQLWRALEPVHAVTYFAAECHEEFADVGLRGGVMSYVAGRTAAMGPVGADIASAVLFSFHPDLVARVLPRAWSFAAPEDVVAARLRGADRVLRRVWGDAPEVRRELDDIAALVDEVTSGCSAFARPMFAAHRGLSRPASPHARLWLAATVLREHRGDGHAAVLLSEGVTACEAHMMVVGTTDLGEAWVPTRGYSPADCSTARASLRDRGWVDDVGRATEVGVRAWRRVEDLTDRAASPAVSGTSEAVRAIVGRLGRFDVDLRSARILPVPFPPVG